MVEHVIDHLAPIPDLGEIFIVTNQKFVQHFTDWSEKYRKEKAKLNFKVINDGTTSDADKLGAIGDIHLVMKKEKIADDLVVVAGDNLFDTALTGFAEFCRAQKKTVLAVYDVGDLEAIKKYNSITLGEDGRVTFFEEKPKNPTSTLTGIALYYFPADVVKMIDTYIAEGNNPDQPGRLIQWLYPKVPVLTADARATLSLFPRRSQTAATANLVHPARAKLSGGSRHRPDAGAAAAAESVPPRAILFPW
jgi:glucose-1-phosphate thymidylyltransferase